MGMIPQRLPVIPLLGFLTSLPYIECEVRQVGGKVEEWTPPSYPKPVISRKTELDMYCYDKLCDPDNLLNDSGRGMIASKIEDFLDHHIKYKYTISSESKENTHEGNVSTVPIEIGVALLQKMDLSSYQDGSNVDAAIMTAAKDFAISIHDSWGVGSVTSDGDTGILLFLSIQDRAFFISKGDFVGFGSVLTDTRIDKIVESAKPLLREEEYSRAILDSIQHIENYLESGPPTIQERGGDFLKINGSFILFAAITSLFMLWNKYVVRNQTRAYAMAQSHLNEIDRGRALALQDRYRSTSCPICLDDFQINGPVREPQSNDNSSYNSEDHLDNNGSNNNQSMLGSDGLPVKLLRCGHIFDDTCWAEWVSSGSGDIRRCPICQRDVGTDINIVQQQPNNQIEADDRRDQRNHRMVAYERERNFRLMRLARRYPRYIRTDQIQRWTQPNFDDKLATDRSFVQNNPRSNISQNQSNSRSNVQSFGGGSSSGARGGRW